MSDKMGTYIILNKTKSTEDTLYVKLGCSKHCYKRFEEVKRSSKFSGSNDELELLQIISVNQYKKLERHMHILFNAYRKVGEWFALSEDKLHSKLFTLNLADYK